MRKIVGVVAMMLVTGINLAYGQFFGLDTAFFGVLEPQTRQEEFVKYIRGGFLMSASYTQFFSGAADIEHLEAVSLSAFRMSVTNFAYQTRESPSYIVSIGVLDNVGAMQGSVNGEMLNSLYADIVGVSGGYMLPLLDYGAYVSAGVKGALFYQLPLAEKKNALNTEFTYAHDFVIEGNSRSIVQTRPMELSAETAVKFGLKVHKNWFASLALGARLNGSSEGKWYLSSDVQRWLGGDDAFLPEYEYWTDDSLPKQNYFLSGTTYFANISISPFY